MTACTHLGRPAGIPDAQWDLGPVREELARLAPEVELLENLRFDPGEKANDPGFVEKLVNGHDAYVNDAFGVSHRRHASIVGPPTRLPSAAGFLLQREIEALGSLLGSPGPALRGRGRRRQGRRQDRCPQGAARAGGRPGRRRWAWPITFLAAAGSRRRCARWSTSERSPSAPHFSRSGKSILLPTDIVALEPGRRFGDGCTEG